MLKKGDDLGKQGIKAVFTHFFCREKFTRLSAAPFGGIL
jgi:hypothetical protein